MSFLSNITEYVTKAVNTVRGAVSSPHVDLRNNDNISSIISGKPAEIGDTFTGNNRNGQQVSKENIGALEQYIDMSCTANGIDKRRFQKLLLSMLDLNNIQEFHALPKDKQIMFLGMVGTSLEKAAKTKAKYNSDIDITKAVITDIKIAQEAINDHLFKNEDEISEMSNNKTIKKTRNNFLENINKLKDEDIDEAIHNFEEGFNTFILEEEEKISELPKAEQTTARAKLMEQIKSMREMIYMEVVMKANSKRAAKVIAIVDPESLVKSGRILIDTRRTPELRMQTANMFTNKEMERIVRLEYEKGKHLAPVIYRDLNGLFVSHKSAEAIKQQEIDYIESRKKYETEGYPEYLSHDLIVAYASGFAGGIQVNEFMSLEERTNALINFYNQEEKYFGDSNVIIEGANTFVDNYIKENSTERPGLENEVDTIRQKVKEATETSSSKSNANNNTKNKNQTDSENQTENTTYGSDTSGQSVSNYSITGSTGIVPKEKQYNKSSENKENVSQTNPIKNDESNNNKSNTKYEMLLSTGAMTLEDAIKSSSKDEIYQIIFSNNNLLAIYEQKAIEYIKNKDKAEDLISLANSSRAIELILIHNRVNQKEKLYDKLEDRASSYQKYLFKEKEEENAIG